MAGIRVMMNAGHDTTAILLRNVLFLLLRTPRCLATLQYEDTRLHWPEYQFSGPTT